MNFTDPNSLKKHHRVLLCMPCQALPTRRAKQIWTTVMLCIQRHVKDVLKAGSVEIANAHSSAKLDYKEFIYLKPENYDAVVVMNDSFNCYGGKATQQMFYFFNFIKDFTGEIWVYVDSFQTFMHVDNMAEKGYAVLRNGKNEGMLKLLAPYEDVLVKKMAHTHFMCDGDLIAMCSGLPNKACIAEDFRSGIAMIVKTNMPKELAKEVCCPSVSFEEKEIDISFATTRPERFQQAKQWLDDKDITVQAFKVKKKGGTLRLDNARVVYVPAIGNMTTYYQVICRRCRASWISINQKHIGALKPERVYGCLMSDIVPMIPLENDPQKTMIQKKELADFCYVSSKEELVQKLKKLRDKDFYQSIIKLQRQEIAEDKD